MAPTSYQNFPIHCYSLDQRALKYIGFIAGKLLRKNISAVFGLLWKKTYTVNLACVYVCDALLVTQ